jgi:hypothetical protein
MKWPFGLLLAVLLISLSACATMSSVVRAKENGTVRTYPVSGPLAWEIAKAILNEKEAMVIENRPEGFLYAESSISLLGAWIEPISEGETKVTFVVKSKDILFGSTGTSEGGLHSDFEKMIESGAAAKLTPNLTAPIGKHATQVGSAPEKPVVLIASPETGQQVSTATVKARGVCATRSEIEAVECFINGEKVSQSRGIGGVRLSSEAGVPQHPFEFDVSLREGPNVVRVSVRTKDGQTSERTVEFSKVAASATVALPTTTSLPTIRAFVAGISSYTDRSLDLKYARKDAELMKEFLLGPCVGVKPDHLRSVYDTEATRENVIGALDEFLKRTSKEDLVLLYFAMHGVCDPDGGDDIYFLCHDSKMQNLEASALSRASLEKLIRKCEAERIMVIADTCHSGMLGTSGIGKRDAGTGSYGLLKRISEIEGKGITFFSASDANEYSQEREDLGHGVFTYYLVRGLKGEADENGDGFVVLQEIEEYTYARVKEQTGGAQRPRMVRPIAKELPLSKVK